MGDIVDKLIVAGVFFLLGWLILGGIIWGLYDWTSVLPSLTEENFKLLIGLITGYYGLKKFR